MIKKAALLFIFSVQISLASAKIPNINEFYKNSRVQARGNTLAVSTGRIQRSWVWTGKGFVTNSLKDLDSGREWITSAASHDSDWNLGNLGNGRLISLKAFVDNDENFTSRHLAIESEIHYARIHVKYVIWAYPDSPGIRTQLWLKKNENSEWKEQLFKPGISETLDLVSNPASVRAFGYMAGIKANMDNLILREETLPAKGITDWASGLVIEDKKAGIILIKESHKHTHMDHGQLVTGAFKRDGSVIEVTGVGITIPDLKTDHYRFCWANWVILYQGRQPEAQLALKEFDRFRFPVHPDRDIYIMANTWGTEDKQPQCKYKARQKNVLKEIETSAEIGVDILQIDDGWQSDKWRPRANDRGDFTLRTGEKIKGTYEVYPDGFSKVRQRAQELGIKLGLWHAWKAPLESIKANYDEGDFKAFKLDFANLRTKDDFDMLYYKGRQLVKYSGYTVVVNWDVTETAPRMGYYFGRDCGNLYLENRKAFTARPPVQYDPFKVLRDAWLIARYMNLNKVQVTFQNKDHTPAGVESDALKYSHSYNFGITLMSSPILFLETQYLDQAARKQIREIIKPYKTQRRQMYQGYVFGIGDIPDNASWTGFQNYHPQTTDGYLTVFRELNSKKPIEKIALNFYKPGVKLQLTNLLTNKTHNVILDNQSRVEFHIPEAPGFQFLKITKQ